MYAQYVCTVCKLHGISDILHLQIYTVYNREQNTIQGSTLRIFSSICVPNLNNLGAAQSNILVNFFILWHINVTSRHEKKTELMTDYDRIKKHIVSRDNRAYLPINQIY